MTKPIRRCSVKVKLWRLVFWSQRVLSPSEPCGNKCHSPQNSIMHLTQAQRKPTQVQTRMRRRIIECGANFTDVIYPQNVYSQITTISNVCYWNSIVFPWRNTVLERVLCKLQKPIVYGDLGFDYSQNRLTGQWLITTNPEVQNIEEYCLL